MNFRKSRFSKQTACVEVGEDWRKARRSNPSGNCVEVASGILIRDTKDNGNGPVLQFSPEAMKAFTARIKG